MPPQVTFLLGLTILGLFFWYFATERSLRKRVLGAVLTLLLVTLCVASIYPPKERIHLGLDLKGGTAFLIRLVKENSTEPISTDAQDRAVEVIRGRVDQFGVGEPVISRVGADQISVQIPGLDTARIAEAREQIQRVAKLEFRLVHQNNDAIVRQLDAGQPVVIPPGYQQAIEERVEHPEGATSSNNSSRFSRANPLLNNAPMPEPEAEKKKVTIRYIVHGGPKPDMTGEHVSRASAIYDQQGYGVSVSFDSEGTRQWGELTSKHVNERLAIMLDGKVVSAPAIREAMFGGNAHISGSFTDSEARDLASVLENPLQTPVKILEERSVSATLGADSIKSGVVSGVIGLSLTLLFVLLYYRLAGLIAWLALLVNMALLFGVMSMFNFVLTLPGIAGTILALATAIDANVLIYERLREELHVGKTLRPALEGAFNKALSSIVDANVTTLITSVILYYFAAGPVKGFAVTLTVGIVASLFAALLVTRNLFAWATESFGLKQVRMLDLAPKQHFDFMGRARACVIASALVIAISMGAFALRGEKNFGIDFRGGDLLVLANKSTTTLTTEAVRDALPSDLRESMVQSENQNGEQLIEIRSPADTKGKVEGALRSAFPAAKFDTRQSESVGGLVGKQLAKRSLLAFGLGMLGILVYMSIRFEFSFALGAIVALFHDVIITVGVFALLGRELSLVMVGAVLTIAGYSINDTIVVYDRIRSGFRDGRKGSEREIMNASINETLGRTILTGGATLIVVAALFLGGGPVLRDFALAMLIGVVVGTYSSVFIASPIVLWTSRRRVGRAGGGGDLRQQVKSSNVAPVPVSPAGA